MRWRLLHKTCWMLGWLFVQGAWAEKPRSPEPLTAYVTKQTPKDTTKLQQGQQEKAKAPRKRVQIEGVEGKEEFSLHSFGRLWSQQHLYQARLTQLGTATLGQAIRELDGVFVWQRDTAGGSVMVRGGMGGRVALRLDGLPLLRGMEGVMEARPWAGVVVWDLSQVGVVRGASSIFFGDQAMTGALVFQTGDDPWVTEQKRLGARGKGSDEEGSNEERNDTEGARAKESHRGGGRERRREGWLWQARGGGIYSSADQAWQSFAIAQAGGERVGVRLSGGYASHQEASIGEGGFLGGSGYQKAHASAKFRLSLTDLWENRLFYSFGWLRDAALLDQRPPYGDQTVSQRQQHLAYLDSRLAIPLLHTHLRALFGFQMLDETQRKERVLAVGSAPLGWREEQLPHARWDAMIHATTQPWSVFALRYGVEFSTESLAVQELEAIGASASSPSPPLQQARQTAISAFLAGQAKIPAGSFRVDIEGGLRLHQYWREITPNAPFAPIEGAGLINASYLGLRIASPKTWALSFFLSEGFRLPSLLESAMAGSQAQAFYLPNPSLEPERVRALHANFSFHPHPVLHASLRFFLQAFSQWLSLQPANWQGQTEIGGLPVMQFQQAEEMVMIGVEASLAWRIWRGWSLQAELAWAEEIGEQPARLPAPIWSSLPNWSARVKTRYQWEGWGGIEIVWEGHLATQATWETPWRGAFTTSQGWWNLHLRADLRLLSWLHLIASFHNLLDLRFVPLPSRLPALGRDIRIALSFSF